jgi:hypothetical protein
MSHPRSSSRHLGQYTVRKVLPPTYPSAQLESPEESEQLVPEQCVLMLDQVPLARSSRRISSQATAPLFESSLTGASRPRHHAHAPAQPSHLV